MKSLSQLLIQFGEQEVALDFPEQAPLVAGNKDGVDIQIGDSLEDGAIFFELRNLGSGEIQVRPAGVYMLLINEKEIEAEKYALPITLQMPELGLDCRLLFRQNLPDLPPLPEISQPAEDQSFLQQLPPIPSAPLRASKQGRRSKQAIFSDKRFLAASILVVVLLVVLGMVLVPKKQGEPEKDLAKPISTKPTEEIKTTSPPAQKILEKETAPSSQGLQEAERLASAGDMAGAIAKYRTLASENVQAANALGVLLLQSDGNREEAFAFFQKAASANNERAIYNLALCYLNGVGCKIDNQKAAELFQKASDLGSTEAMLLLSELYAQGRGVAVDDKAALSLCEKAANNGSSDALVSLAMKYTSGKGVERNIPKALELLEKAVAMKNASAMNNLATLYARGQGVGRDIGKAKLLYRDAAALGDKTAKANLSLLEQDDTADSAKMQEKNSNQPSQRNFSETASKNEKKEDGDPQSPQESNRVLEFGEAFSQANDGDAYAQAILSIYYGLGYKTQKDVEKAAEYAMKSAKQGHPLGIYRLGVMRQNGEGMVKSEEQGKKLRAQSVEGLNKLQGDPYALTALGVMLYRGEVLEKNKSEAARVYRLAADQGYAPAQYSYAVCLNQGLGVDKDPDLAKRYLDKSAAQFYPPALEGMPK